VFGFGSQDSVGRRRPVVADVAAARVRRHAHLIPLRLPLRVRALIMLALVPYHVCSVFCATHVCFMIHAEW
jgi:hypothetical protein